MIFVKFIFALKVRISPPSADCNGFFAHFFQASPQMGYRCLGPSFTTMVEGGEKNCGNGGLLKSFIFTVTVLDLSFFEEGKGITFIF
jgi:hypothetical protein